MKLTTCPSFTYPRQARFHCNHCGICCRDTPHKTRRILARRVEAEKLSRSLGMPIAEFAEETNQMDGFPYEFRKVDGECVFHHNDRCTVYSLRPLTCRVYPFWIERDQRRFTFNVTKECPEVGCGPKLSRSFFERLLQEACFEQVPKGEG